MKKLIRRLHHDEQGQDILEYTIIVAFAISVIAVIATLYSTLRSQLTTANDQIKAIQP
jgi:Flp pilus assembly pilin Flp